MVEPRTSASAKAARETRRRVTTADVARSVGVSRATVGFVLNDTPGQTISEATRERVLAAAAELGYRPHTAARALASGKTRIILLILPDWPLDFTLRRHVEEATLALDEAGYTLVTYTPLTDGHSRPLWESLQPDVAMSITPLPAERIAQLRAAGVTKIVPDPDRFVIDEYSEPGPGMQVMHLIERGHRRLAVIGSSDVRIADLVAVRAERAQAAASEHAADVVFTARIALEETEAAHAIESARVAGATGIVAYNDDIAFALLTAALRAGIQVPGELAIIGHDDTPLAGLSIPRLSSVRLDISGLGRYLAGIALSVAEGFAPPHAEPTTLVQVISRETT
jgi:DNA-binding LacI/PurR family transcriptional regulator